MQEKLPPISVAIISFNEEANIGKTLVAIAISLQKSLLSIHIPQIKQSK